MNAQTRKHTQTDTHTQRILFRAFLVKRYLNNKMWKTILNYNPVELNISDYIKQRNTHLNNTREFGFISISSQCSGPTWPAAIYLNWFRGPVDDNVTTNYPLQSPKSIDRPFIVLTETKSKSGLAPGSCWTYFRLHKTKKHTLEHCAGSLGLSVLSGLAPGSCWTDFRLHKTKKHTLETGVLLNRFQIT